MTIKQFNSTYLFMKHQKNWTMKQNIICTNDAEIAEENKEHHDKPVSYVGTPLQNDRWIYRIVVSALALTLVSSLGGAVWLQSQDKDIPEILIGLGTGALGGLAGLLVPTPSKE